MYLESAPGTARTDIAVPHEDPYNLAPQVRVAPDLRVAPSIGNCIDGQTMAGKQWNGYLPSADAGAAIARAITWAR